MKLNSKLVLLNNAVVLVARIVIVLTLFHFIFTNSLIHGIIISVAYLAIELMDLQLKFMVQNSMDSFLTALMPKEKPNLTVVQNDEDNSNNETSH